MITTQWTFSLNNWYSIECPATYLAEWIVWIIHDDHFCFAVELTRQLQRIKFPVSAGNEAALLVLYKQYLSFCRPTYGRSQTTSCPSIFYTFNISPPPKKKIRGVSFNLPVCVYVRKGNYVHQMWRFYTLRSRIAGRNTGPYAEKNSEGFTELRRRVSRGVGFGEGRPSPAD